MATAATQEKLPVADNGAMALLSQIFQNSSSLFGSGETTTKETTAPANITPLGDNDINNLIQGIFDKAKTQFGPNISNSVAAGNRAYSDTTLADMQGRAQGYATANAAGAKLDAITKNNQIAAQIAERNSTKTVSTAASPAGNLLKLAGIGAAGYSLAKKVKAGSKNEDGGTTSDIYDNIFKSQIAPNAETSGGTIGGTTETLGNVEEGFSPPTLNTDALLNLNDASAVNTLSDTGGDVSSLASTVSNGGGFSIGEEGSGSFFSDIFGFENPVTELTKDIPVIGDVTEAVSSVPFLSEIFSFFGF